MRVAEAAAEAETALRGQAARGANFTLDARVKISRVLHDIN